MGDSEFYIGLLSGTSIDGVDAAIVEINLNKINLISCLNYEIPNHLKSTLNSIIKNPNINLNDLGKTHRELGLVFSEAVIDLLAKANMRANHITAIGFHGQTIMHQPELPLNFTIQIGCPSTIIEQTQIPVVTDFRQRDMVNGGQGAPLAPLFHQKFFSAASINRAIVNIGGITNITLLQNLSEPIKEINIASDIGPGNTLLDLWYRSNNKINNNYYDQDGCWAKTGQVHTSLLENLLSDPYFKQPWPKSTGREYFNLLWLDNYLKNYIINPSDVQRTLLELTASIIAHNVKNNSLNATCPITETYICGGGASNVFLMNRLQDLLSPIMLHKTDKLDIPSDWVEAALFAWLAYCNWQKHKLNLKYITGNKNTNSILGCAYY